MSTTTPSATFTPEEILAAIRDWHGRYGEAPRMVDWEPSRARRAGQEWRAQRFEAERWPSARMVRGQFGTLNAAVQAAGLRPRAASWQPPAGDRGPDAVLHAFAEWRRRYGEIPTLADWDPERARELRQEWRITRYEDGDWPSAYSVLTCFGSFTKAAEAAGLRAAQEQTATGQTSIPKVMKSPAPLANHVRAVAQARASGDAVAIHAALVTLAGAALAWAEIVGGN